MDFGDIIYKSKEEKVSPAKLRDLEFSSKTKTYSKEDTAVFS